MRGLFAYWIDFFLEHQVLTSNMFPPALRCNFFAVTQQVSNKIDNFSVRASKKDFHCDRG